MTQKEQNETRIETLIYKLNHVGIQRKLILDQLWVLEDEMEKSRIELMVLVDGRGRANGQSKNTRP